MAKLEILPGAVFKSWTVLGEIEGKPLRKNKIMRRFLCKCICGKEKPMELGDLRSKTRCFKCVSCSSTEKNQSRRKFEDSGGVISHYITHLIGHAVKRGIEVQISMDDLSRQWEVQSGKCALTGWDLALKTRWNEASATASVDRIDSDKPYTVDNIQWVHKMVNRCKLNYTEERFFEMCNAVTAYKQQTQELRGSRPWREKSSE